MTEPILKLIKDFQLSVDIGVNLLREYYKYDDDKPIIIAYRDKIVPKSAIINYKGLRSFNFHGLGCNFEFTDKEADVGFSFGPSFRHDGFNSWRLWHFARSQKNAYEDFIDIKQIEAYLQQLLIAESILQDIEKLGYQYYLREDIKE
jgi:hypothetical protein